MRTIAAPAAALLGNRLALCLLIEMQLTATLRVATCGVDIDWGGNTFIGGRIAGVEPIREQGGEIVGVTFSLGGVRTEDLALALGEVVQGKVARVWTALMDPETQAIADVVLTWVGTLDQMSVREDAGASISVTAEHRGITFSRAKTIRYSDADQQRKFPGDRCLEYLVSQSQHQDIWPAAAFFRQ